MYAENTATVPFYPSQLQASVIQPDIPAVYFSEVSEEWFRETKVQVERSTYEGYGYTLRILNEYFGDMPINAIKPRDVILFINARVEKQVSLSQISKCKSMLNQVFYYAASNELIWRNPALGIQIPKKIKENQKRHNHKDAYTDEEVELIAAQVPNNLLGNSIVVLIKTGMRVQELLALTKDDIAKDGSYIDVKNAIKMVKGTATLGVTKTYSSSRIIPVPTSYRKYVMYIREHGGKKRILESRREDGLMAVGTFRWKYEKVIKKMENVRYLTPHCCRHTYVTELQTKGVPVSVLMKLTGHSNFNTAMGYTHISQKTITDAVEVLN